MKVLVIEDHPSNVELLILRLEALGCTPIVALSAAEGLRKASGEQPHLILVDLQLSEGQLEGVGLVRQLQEDPATAAIPVVVHSVYVTDPVEMSRDLPSASGYLPKPFRMRELADLIALHRPRQVPPEQTGRRGSWWPGGA